MNAKNEVVSQRPILENLAFQKWLKNNAGKTYQEAITAYYRILKKEKTEKTRD